MTPPAPGSVLDRRTLNRTLLARQHLLARTSMPVEDLVEHLVGMQAQVPRDPYISLWSRLRDFDPGKLETAILERTALRMTLMRTTLHLVTARDAPVLRAAMQSVCERGFRSSPFRRQIEGVDLDAVLAAGIAAVEERPRTVAELASILAERWPGFDGNSLAYAVRYLVPLVQVPPRGLLRRSSASKITTLSSWLDVDWPSDIGTDEAAEDAILRYLHAFGPATVADISAWSWLTGVRAIVDRLRPGLVSYRDETGRELLDVEDGVFADPDDGAPVRFLGEFDNVFLSHADRTRITGDGAWGTSFARKGVFFVGGFLAGAWRLAEAAAEQRKLVLEPHVGVSSGARDELVAEGERLVRFLTPGAASVDVTWRTQDP